MSFTPKVKRVLTRPFLKLEKGTTVYIRAEAAIYEGKPDPKGQKEAPKILEVTDLTTGEAALIMAPAVLRSLLDEHYTDNSYVGLCFQITKTTNAGDDKRKYAKFDVVEIEDESAETKPAAKVKK